MVQGEDALVRRGWQRCSDVIVYYAWWSSEVVGQRNLDNVHCPKYTIPPVAVMIWHLPLMMETMEAKFQSHLIHSQLLIKA